jgi:hypothetical protein
VQGSATAATIAKAEPGFQGVCDDLRGYLFDCAFGKQMDRCTMTMKEISEYIGINFTYGADIRWSLEHEEEFVVPKPIRLDTNEDPIDRRIWENDIQIRQAEGKTRRQFPQALLSDPRTVHGLLESQVRVPVQLSSHEGGLRCFPAHKGCEGNHIPPRRQKVPLGSTEKIRFYALRQGKDVKNSKYLELFQTHVAIVEQFGGEVSRGPVIVIRELEFMGVAQMSTTDPHILEARKVGKEKYLAVALIRAADTSRYSRIMDDLVDQFTMGHNNYPINVTSAYNLLINYRVTKQSTARIINESEGVAFATVDVTKEKRDLLKIRCFRCQKRGHFATQCPDNETNKAPDGAEAATEALQQLVLADSP